MHACTLGKLNGNFLSVINVNSVIGEISFGSSTCSVNLQQPDGKVPSRFPDISNNSES